MANVWRTPPPVPDPVDPGRDPDPLPPDPVPPDPVPPAEPRPIPPYPDRLPKPS